MKCLDVRESLSARIDGEWESTAVDALERHLAGCAICHGWYERANELRGGTDARMATTDPSYDGIIQPSGDVLETLFQGKVEAPGPEFAAGGAPDPARPCCIPDGVVVWTVGAAQCGCSAGCRCGCQQGQACHCRSQAA